MRWSSISLTSLRASSTGCTFALKARPNTPSTSASILCSIARRTLNSQASPGPFEFSLGPRRPGRVGRRLDGCRRLLDGLRWPAHARSSRVRLEREGERRRRRRREDGHVRVVRRRGDGDSADDDGVGGGGERPASAHERQRGCAERQGGGERDQPGVAGELVATRPPGRARLSVAGDAERADASAPPTAAATKTARATLTARRRGPANRRGRAAAAARGRRSRRARPRARRAGRPVASARARAARRAPRPRRGRRGPRQ